MAGAIWYGVVIFCLALYMLCSLWLLASVITQLHLLFKSGTKKRLATGNRPGTMPTVTIQVPVYNERYVIAALMQHLGQLDYPRHLFDIQVLDDSTDDTSSIIDTEAAHLEKLGVQISIIRRENRTGFKAGALQSALTACKGELIAIFDADFLPAPDFLKRIVVNFANARVGGVQARWSYKNLHENFLTTIQAFLLDSHFNLEQNGRSAAGYFVHFNGTAGVWRKQCILEVGGWNGDVLTEDLELSYRAQLKGWQIKYDNELSVPSELPSNMNAFKTQQFRWSKGMAQTARKYLATIIRADVNSTKKWHAAFHLLGSLSFVAVVGTIVLAFPILIGRQMFPQFIHVTNILFVSALTLPLMTVYYYNGTSKTFSTTFFWKYFPVFLVVYMALSVQNSIGVIQGLAGKKSPFVRTPKTNAQGIHALGYLKTRWSRLNYVELAMIFYVLLVCVMSIIWNDFFLLLLLLMMLTGLVILVVPALNVGKRRG